MLLSKLLTRTHFDSYADFKKNYELHVPEHFNFARDVVDAWAEADPEKRALVWLNDRGERRTFTFREISDLSKQAANFLSSLGLKKGDRILTLLKRNWQYWVTAVACHRMGVVIIPASVQLATKDIVYRVNAAGIRAIIATDDEWSQAQVEAAKPQCPDLEFLLLARGGKDGWIDYDQGIAQAKPEFTMPHIDNSDVLVCYFTSGTTGMPKLVVHDQTYPLGHIVTAKFWQRVEDGGLHLTVSDSGWAKFGWGCIYGQWISGSAVLGYDMDKFSARHLIDVVRNERPTTFCVPPTMYRFMMKEGITREDFQSVRSCGTAGEALAAETSREFQRITGLVIHEGFGQSEGTVLIGNFPWFDPCPGALGKPSPLYNIQLVDADGNSCEDGEEGTIAVMDVKNHPPTGLFTGYFQNPEMTQEKLGGAYYDTGDVAWRDSNGYYWFVGRNDDVIKCSGYRIGPFEVESALLEHPAVVECAITGAPDPIRGQVVKATIVLAKGYEGTPELTKELQNHVKHATAPYKYPRVIEYVDELPKTIGGKIKRAQIRKADEG